MIAWKQALDGKTSEEVAAIDLLTFIARYDPIWHKDKYVEAESKKRASRISTLPKDEVPKWKKALEAVHDDDISELWTIAFVVDIDRLFGPQGFLPDQSSLLLARLAALPKSAIESLAETDNVAKAKAAIYIVAVDAFYVKEQFQQPKFNEAVRLLKSKLPEARNSRSESRLGRKLMKD